MSTSTVTSEALQLKLRQLLPSQQGFGTDLSASDTIIPIIDLTAAAEGSDIPASLQQALSFGSQTAFSVQNTTTTIQNNTGFWRIRGVVEINAGGAVSVNLTDGSSTKLIAQYSASSSGFYQNLPFDLIVFFAAGESMNVVANANARYGGSVRQVATIDGTLVNPVGFTPQ